MKNILKVIVALVSILIIGYLKDKNEIPGLLLNALPAVVFLLSSFVIIEITKWIYRFKVKLKGGSDNVTAGLENIFQVLIFISFFLLILHYFGIGVTEFFTSISIVAAAIAIVSKEYLVAIISGFVISFTKLINIGDYVQLGEFKGKIIDITLTKIFLQNDQGELIVLNNDKAYFGDMVNYSQSNRRRVNIGFEIDPREMPSIDEFESKLKEQLSEFHEFLVEDSVSLRIDELKTDKIIFSLFYTLTQLEPEVERNIRKQTIRKILSYVQENLKNNSFEREQI